MEIEAKEISKGVLTKKEARTSSSLSHQGGGPNQFLVHLGIQEQSRVKSTPKAHMGSIFDDPHMLGKII